MPLVWPIISTIKLCTKQPFPGQNTQQTFSGMAVRIENDYDNFVLVTILVTKVVVVIMGAIRGRVS